MHNATTVHNRRMPLVEFQGQRVVTFAMVDAAHQRPDGTAAATLRRHRHRFTEKRHFFELTGDVLHRQTFAGLFPASTVDWGSAGHLARGIKHTGKKVTNLAWDMKRPGKRMSSAICGKVTLITESGFTQAVKLSKLDMRSLLAGGPAARKKGEDCGPALWLCSSVDHYPGVSDFLLRCRSLSARKTESGRKLDAFLTGSAGGSVSGFCVFVMRQPFGSDLVFSCCASCWAMSTSSRSCAPACVPISPIRSSTSRAPLRLDNSFSSPLSPSWRREISFRAAETRKAAMLSPSFLSASIPSITSCGIRMFLSCDFVFTLPVAIIPPEKSLVCEQYTIKCVFKMLDTNTHLKLKSIHTLSTDREQVRHKNSDAPECLESLPRRLTTTVNVDNEVVMKNHTTAPQRFTFLFLAVVRANPQAHPHREQITAISEREARSLLAGRFVLVFAGRLPVLGVAHG